MAATYRINMLTATAKATGGAWVSYPLAGRAEALAAIAEFCFAMNPETAVATATAHDAAGEVVEVLGLYLESEAMTDAEIAESMAEGFAADAAAEAAAEAADAAERASVAEHYAAQWAMQTAEYYA